MKLSHHNKLIRVLKLDLIQPSNTGSASRVIIEILLDDFAVMNMQQHDNHHLTSFTFFELSWIALNLWKFLNFNERHFFILNGIYRIQGLR